MTDQTFIADDGTIGSQPLTWDGQPLYSPETVREGLFDAGAFEQQPGQLAIEEAPTARLRKITVFLPCERHEPMFATETRARRAEVMVEGGYASSPCTGNGCEMRPGTDFFTPSFVTSSPLYHIGDDQ